MRFRRDRPGCSTATTGNRPKGCCRRPVLERVKKGDYWYKVRSVDPDKFKQNYSTTFWAASEANAGKYDVDAGDLWPEGREDRQGAGILLRLSVSRRSTRRTPSPAARWRGTSPPRPRMGGGGGATFTLNGIDTNGEYKRIKAWIHSMAFLGRAWRSDPQSREPRRAPGLSGVLEPQRHRRCRRSGQAHQQLDLAGQGVVLRAGDAPRAPGKRRLALRAGGRAWTSSPTISTATAARSSTTSGRSSASSNILAPGPAARAARSDSRSATPALEVKIPYFQRRLRNARTRRACRG